MTNDEKIKKVIEENLKKNQEQNRFEKQLAINLINEQIKEGITSGDRPKIK